jgi:membrane protein implicated in regulation of membrane protease activity
MSYQSSLDRLIGQSGIVIDTVPSERHGVGVVKVGGQLWSANTDWAAPLEPGTAIWVVGRTSLVLAVIPERI